MDDGGKAGIFRTEYAVFPFFYGIFRLFYRMWRKMRPSFPQVLKSVWKTIHKGREVFPAETVPGGNRFRRKSFPMETVSKSKKTSPDESGDAEFSFLRNPTSRRDASERNQIHKKISGSERCDQMYIGLSSVYALEFLSGHVNG